MKLKLLEYVTLIVLAVAVGGVAHYAIDPPLVGVAAGLPVGLAIGAAHSALFARIRSRR